MMLQLVLLFVLINLSEGISDNSYEHQLRAMLLNNSDKIVRPEIKGNSRIPIPIFFGFKLIKLAKVNIKEETITVDAWVTMEWKNTFISWDAHKYGRTDMVNFLPTEIWFPDISLINNADTSVHRAGGPNFFSSLVTVNQKGLNTWNGPATFTASCDMDLASWPFDSQTCKLQFASLAYPSDLLVIKEKKSPRSIIEDSANWQVNANVETTLSETDFGRSSPFNFSQITFTIEMGRRYQYHMFYMVAPCLALALLTLVSFWIPSESGERIGFVTTLLLGMMVFLLIVPDSLPESSQSIPVLGMLMMSTMIMVGFALLATIFVLRCYHATGRPPQIIKCLTKSSNLKKTAPSEIVDNPKTSQTDIKLNVVQQTESAEESSTFDKSAVEDENGWPSLSKKFDRMFFLIFCVVIAVLYGSSLGPAIDGVSHGFEE